MLCLVHNRRPSGNPLRGDPTRTGLIRRNFEGEIKKRILAWKRDIYYFLVIQDALGLERTAGSPVAIVRNSRPDSVSTIPTVNSFSVFLNNPAPQVTPKAFEFRTATEKVAEFRKWLEQQRKARLVTPIDPLRPNQPWTAKYVTAAFEKGMARAFGQVKKSDLAKGAAAVAQKATQFTKEQMAAPVAVSKVQLLATRALEDLDGITADMAGKMNKILAQGLIDGDNPATIAKEMFDTVDGLIQKRAVLVARTEVINAHAEGQLDAFEEMNVDNVGVEAEWLTAGDDRVCPECEAKEGQIFTIDEARGMIPLHPNCRCAWTPAL